MTPNQINEVIARAVGEFDAPKTKPTIAELEKILASDPNSRVVAFMPDGQVRSIPDYFNSLDAINQAERYAKEHLMDADQWERYGNRLEKIHPTAILSDHHDFATLMVELTAAQRATTLVKILGLWTD